MKHKLTQQDVDKMKAEIEHRKVEERPELLEHVKEARAHGDLSENFEYHAAKKEKNRNESRIRYLERMIRTCEIVEDHSDADQVGLNKTVTLYFEEDDETDKFSFVTTVLVDTMQNRVSIESPLGKALLGHKKGERVYIPVNPQYGYYVEIKEIEPFNEDVLRILNTLQSRIWDRAFFLFSDYTKSTVRENGNSPERYGFTEK